MTVSPLAPTDGVTSDAVTLFVERAGAVRPGFGIFDEQTADAVIEICETLDGLPLGIELAAARMAAMSAVEVRDRLGDRFRLLTGPELGPDRQATLRHAVAWSYDLLDDDERAILRTASVFAGGFDLPALCAVAEASDDVEVLRAPGLVGAQVPGHRPPRLRADPVQPVRDDPGVRRRAAGGGRRARGGRATGTRRTSRSEAVRRWERWNGPEWRTQVDWVQTELANLRSAFRWSLDRGQVEVATDVAAHAALMGFSVELFETIGWAEALLDGGEPGPTSGGFPGCTPRRGTPASSDGPRPRPRTPTGPPSWRADRATSPASPATRRSSRLSARSTAGTWTATSS